MPMIYKRFTDKTAEEWRQIYKSLQLLEFLVKNGSERVIDDARSHLSLLRMLRQFHYIDQNGKDQGLNVRNRAQELAKLLGDVDMIRAERKKARANRNKFGGIEGGMKIGGFSGGSGMTGFGNEDSYGGYSGRVYGDGGGFGGDTSGFQGTTSSRRGNRFEEYDEYNEGTSSASSRRKTTDPSPARARREPKKPEPPKQPEPDLFDFGEDDEPATTSSSQAAGKKPAGNGLDMLSPDAIDDDEFDDFQSAAPPTDAGGASKAPSIPPPTSTFTTTSSTQFAAPQPVSGTQGANLSDLVGFSSMTPAASSTNSAVTSPLSPPGGASRPAMQAQQQPIKPTGYQAAQPNYFTSVQAPSTQPLSSTSTGTSAKPQSTVFGSSAATSGRPTSISGAAPKKSAGGGDAFGSLWSSASTSAGIQKSNSTAKQGPNLASMAKEKASAGIWGAPAPASSGGAAGMSSQSTGSGQKSGGAFDDLLG
ncbi:Epsin-3, clathrin recruitment and traffic between the Golgi and endosome [Arachnomyces sp. PD_36]|nr:Epsin-3, clathrin recruitment and traffic between the Golgi and endosome [Arachnomyces sp. PD_36]